MPVSEQRESWETHSTTELARLMLEAIKIVANDLATSTCNETSPREETMSALFQSITNDRSLDYVKNDLVLAGIAKKMLAERELRQAHVPKSYLGEPAWDMMLDLFVARVEQSEISTKSASIAANAPASTALRWIGILEQDGYIRRKPSKLDNRQNLVELTEDGFNAVRSYLRSHSSRFGEEPLC